MKVTLVFTSLLTAIVGALIASLFLAHYGPRGYEQLQEHATLLHANIARLEASRAELIATAELYQRNRDAVIVEARTLGYVAPGQQVIRLDTPSRDKRQSPGSLLPPPPRAADRRSIIRAIALAVFGIATALQLAFNHRTRTERRTYAPVMRRAS
ncbi:MAG: FtsB family cell division protein, partial [Spirochaetales bacterium]